MEQNILSPSRSITLDDVADRCGVSYQTVSRVVNDSPQVAEKTRTRIRQAISELGYQPNLAARRLASRRSRVIGMVGVNITYYGPAQVMLSIEEAAKRRGYYLMFAGVDQPNYVQLTAAITDLRAHQVDGLVLGVHLEGKIDLVRPLCQQTPFVTLDASAAPDIPAMLVDQAHGVRLSIHHLLELGHRRIATITGPAGWPPAVVRRKAWRQTLREAGLAPGPCAEGDWSAESGYAAALRLLRRGRADRGFTAIVAANDQMALGALRALHVSGLRVPEDISVVGYDDLPEARFFHPPLTTVRNDFASQGERCVEVLLRLIHRQPVELPLPSLPTELLARDSTGPMNSFA